MTGACSTGLSDDFGGVGVLDVDGATDVLTVLSSSRMGCSTPKPTPRDFVGPVEDEDDGAAGALICGDDDVACCELGATTFSFGVEIGVKRDDDEEGLSFESPC